MDKNTEIFIREFFLQTKNLDDKELSDYIDKSEYEKIKHFDESKGHLDVVFEIIANEREIDLGGLTEDFDYTEPEKRKNIEHRIVLVFSNQTFTNVERKLVRLSFKEGQTTESVVDKFLESKSLNYTYQRNNIVEYISNGIHNINHVFYVYTDNCTTDIFNLKPKNREDAFIWLEHLNKLFIMSMSKSFSDKISEKRTQIKQMAKIKDD